ncbi:16988_t:CDS:2 [Gigaspora margarita]|uniref:16988_t:CDS:1 n=1 Tax=Gigaspora margarita TaxID=4874 RepID=A0ABN7UEY8_GIGMA|nr:16988_t:CDS:2 [Gigaspora margarita]
MELCEFFANIKRQDGKPYKPKSIVSAYTLLYHYIFEVSAIKNMNINDRFQFPILYLVDEKIMELQDQELGKIDQSKGLTAEEIHQILLYLESEINNRSWFGKKGLEKNTLNNMMKKIAHISDLNVNEHKMMQFSGHCSTDGLHTYKISNNKQWLKNPILLLNALQEFPIVQQRESQQEESQVMQQDESQQEKFQVIQPDESQATQYEESQVMQHDV